MAQDIERTDMNADQKKRVAHEISNWKNACNCRAVQLTGDRMAALLQELVDAPEPEPVARVTGYYAGYLTIATVDGRVLPAGTALYLAPPAPSVPDGWKNAAEWLRNNYQDYPNISSLCEAMVAQSANNGSN